MEQYWKKYGTGVHEKNKPTWQLKLERKLSIDKLKILKPCANFLVLLIAKFNNFS